MLAAVKCGRTVRRAWEEQEMKTLLRFDMELKLSNSKLSSRFSIRYASWSFLKRKKSNNKKNFFLYDT